MPCETSQSLQLGSVLCEAPRRQSEHAPDPLDLDALLKEPVQESAALVDIWHSTNDDIFSHTLKKTWLEAKSFSSTLQLSL